jgi:hypothetical protein
MEGVAIGEVQGGVLEGVEILHVGLGPCPQQEPVGPSSPYSASSPSQPYRASAGATRDVKDSYRPIQQASKKVCGNGVERPVRVEHHKLDAGCRGLKSVCEMRESGFGVFAPEQLAVGLVLDASLLVERSGFKFIPECGDQGGREEEFVGLEQALRDL